MHTDDGAAGAHVAVPAQSRGLFDGDSGLNVRWEHGVAVVLGLLVEQLRLLTDNDSAAEVGEHLSYLLEGAMARSGLEGEPSRLRRARAIAVGMLADLNRTP